MRNVMKSYWTRHTAQASMEEMLMDSNAVRIAPEEMAEIFSLLPDLKGKVVLELACGIG